MKKNKTLLKSIILNTTIKTKSSSKCNIFAIKRIEDALDEPYKAYLRLMIKLGIQDYISKQNYEMMLEFGYFNEEYLRNIELIRLKRKQEWENRFLENKKENNSY